MHHDQLVSLRAVDLVRMIRSREVSARQVLDAHLERIDQVNGTVNAIITLTAEAARATADEVDARLGRGEEVGPLAGLPVAHKDLALTRGIRTTFGSPLFADHVPTENALIVERLQAADAITIGKTNVPEFGAGSHTFNPVFGATRNPWATDRTAGGSSGGAAVALACRMQPIADGSDTGGSLRNPGNFNNIVGFRPSPGRVPRYPNETGWFPISVDGPMARTVEDVALMLSAIAGPDRRSPIAIDVPGSVFAASLDRDLSGVRVACSPTLGGLPVDPAVRAVIDTAPAVLDDLGCIVEEADPDLAGADEAFEVWRAWRMQISHSDKVREHRDQVKQTVIWNTEVGEALTGPAIGRAEAAHTGVYHRIRTFMERYEFLILPVNQVPPFPIDVEYPTEIDGVAMESYIDWMKTCSRITVTGHPAISVPCGFTPDGLPVGLQIVGRHRDDLGVLQIAKAFQDATGLWKREPPVLAPPS